MCLYPGVLSPQSALVAYFFEIVLGHCSIRDIKAELSKYTGSGILFSKLAGGSKFSMCVMADIPAKNPPSLPGGKTSLNLH